MKAASFFILPVLFSIVFAFDFPSGWFTYVQAPIQGLLNVLEDNAGFLFSWHKFIPPKKGDLRSPCPGLNALANHGFLPRNGKGMTIPVVLDACLSAFNILPEPQIIMVAKMALFTTDAKDSFTLEDLRLHGTIEHDASISRSDDALGDNLAFNETLFNQFLAQSSPGKDFYDPVSAGQVQHDRLSDSIVRNENVTNTIKEFMQRNLESSLYLGVMGDPLTGIAPKRFVDILFREERIPYNEGWKRSNVAITSAMFNNIAAQIGANSDWMPSGGCPWLRLQPEGPEKLPA